MSERQDRTVITLTSGGKRGRVLKIGDVIGDSYRLKALIGQGGMGYVFRAEHIMIGRDYAVKVLAPDQINENTWQRFQSEGKAVARLDHINIVKIYNMGVDGGDCPYYVMDLLDGVELSTCIADKMKLSLPEILDIFIQLADGFGYAHSRGIIHRDVKPGNIMLVDSGGKMPTAKIVDFGIAKMTGAQGNAKQSQTATGEVFGSPLYMSPEQCLGSNIDQRSDIYSLGCTLFELLSGHPPFVGENALATVMMHQNKPAPSLKDSTGAVWNEELEIVIAKMLMKRPVDRYQTMDQLRHDLERIRDNKSVGRRADTGFGSSVDHGLQDIGKKYEASPASKTRKFILSAISLTVLGFIAAACYFSFRRVAEPVAPAVHTDFQLETHTQKDINEHAAINEEQKPEATREIEAVGPITSTIDKKNKQRIIHFPPKTKLGKLAYFAGPKQYDCDFDEHDDPEVDAIGDVKIPLDAQAILIVSFADDRKVWDNPKVLEKIGPNELVGLRIESANGIDLYGSQKDQDEHPAKVAALAAATRNWKRVRYFEFYNCPVNEAAMDALVPHTKLLDTVIIRGIEISGAALARKPYIKNLKCVDMITITDPDDVLAQLKNSKLLRAVIIKGGVTTAGINNLLNCPNLQLMEIADRTMTADTVRAISKLKHLDVLDLRHCGFEPTMIPALAELKSVRVLKLKEDSWSALDRDKLRRLLPSLTWTVKQPDGSIIEETNKK